MELPGRMRLPNSAELDSDPTFQRMLQESRSRQGDRLVGRERTVVLLTGTAFLAIAVPLALFVQSDRAFDLPVAVALIGLYALAMRVEFHTGSGWTDPSQLVLVPMLFLLPVPLVPLLVAAAQLLFRAPEFLRGSIPLERAVIRVGDAWYAVGPAAVFIVAGAGAPTGADWPIYLVALGAQFGFDFANSVARECVGFGVRLADNVREVRWIYFVDSLLSGVGLLVAFAAFEQQWAFVLVIPLLALLTVFSRERSARIDNALTLSEAYRGTAHLLGELLETSDEYTGKHTRSVVILAHQVGEQLGLDEATLRDVEFGALLHDVGKVSVPNEIINKPGKLTDEEWTVMKAHPAEGGKMLERIGGVLEQVGQVVRHHHERWDGTGYPDGLVGEEIPIASRVIAACDAYHAMTSGRSYRKALPRELALAELRENSGTQFDPAVVEALIGVVEGWDRRGAEAEGSADDVEAELAELTAAAPGA